MYKHASLFSLLDFHYCLFACLLKGAHFWCAVFTQKCYTQ